MNTFSRLPVCFVRGEGTALWDDEGNKYLDALGGIAVAILGHCHPKITDAITTQANKLIHISNLFQIQEQTLLSTKFCSIAEMDRVFFGNSGAEANEVAIKIARKYGNDKGIKKPAIITATGSFHGRTMATLSATGSESLQKGFHPMLEDFIHVNYNDIAAIQKHSDNANVVAVMMEPILGEAGIVPPNEGYLKALRKICDDNNWLLILDEIQTGMGRTGKWFAYQHEEILPDIMTSAKALANGLPIGACGARGAAAEILTPGTHGSTFGGNPLACHVAATTIDVIQNENLMENASSIGSLLKSQLLQKIGTDQNVANIRGKGMLLAIELNEAFPNLAITFLQHGLVVNITGGGKVIRLLPAIIMTESEARQVAEIIHTVVSKLSVSK
ncbi:UNVERIFIED_CONTAM: hypothetical protein GTU68_027095 [Idotea baltica]|nr:hypothetical protein [Idotea baltica]